MSSETVNIFSDVRIGEQVGKLKRWKVYIDGEYAGIVRRSGGKNFWRFEADNVLGGGYAGGRSRTQAVRVWLGMKEIGVW